nr:MAG TPA: hypothetical protein [Caudoviricetes sp.]
MLSRTHQAQNRKPLQHRQPQITHWRSLVEIHQRMILRMNLLYLK